MTLSADQTYMKVAEYMKNFSEDEETQVGACIVDPRKNVIVSSGTNRSPDGCEGKFPMTNGIGLDSKYLYVVHAEANAILKRGGDVEGSNIYTTLFPCNECAKLIIQSKIGKVFYLDEKTTGKNKSIYEISRTMLELANIPIIQVVLPVNE